MAEALLRLVDKPLTSVDAIDSQRTRRGDVIVVQPDGWNWGTRERTSPDWIIVKAPTMTLEEAQALTSSEPAVDEADELSGRPRWKRYFFLDLDKVLQAAPALAPLFAHPRVQESVTVPDVNVARFLKTTKTAFVLSPQL